MKGTFKNLLENSAAKSKIPRGEREVHLLDWTTAWVCSEVPEAILVRAQAASNWRDGLQRGGSKVSGIWPACQTV